MDRSGGGPIIEDQLEVETLLKSSADIPTPELDTIRSSSSSWPWTILFFVVFWVVFQALDYELPYLKNGSDVILNAKRKLEASGTVFPANSQAQRVLIFGNSKTLAGFLPSEFDQLAASSNRQVISFNSGFPGIEVFLPQLKLMCERGQAPDVMFLTLPWRPDPPKRDLFHLVQDDHAIIQAFFPFRGWLRDFTDFLMAAHGHGGILAHYREAREDEQHLSADRGYYLIEEQSRFPGGRIPDNFHLASDQPETTKLRSAPAHSSESAELNDLVRKYRIQCYYVPSYYRIGEYAPSPARNDSFASTAQSATPCKLLGPEYFLYPNRFFSDQTHLNTAGARVYTEDLFQLLKSTLGAGDKHALQ